MGQPYFPAIISKWIKGFLLKSRTVPSTPSAGFLHIYHDSVDGKLKTINSSGTIKILSDALVSPIAESDVTSLVSDLASKYSATNRQTVIVNSEISTVDASKITTGTMATARLGSGVADATTFLRGDQTYASVSSSLEILHNVTLGTVDDYTYTPASALLFTTYSQIIIVLKIELSNADTLQMVLNGVGGTSNLTSGHRWNGVTNTNFTIAGAAQLQIGSTALFSGANTRSAFLIIELSSIDATANQILGMGRAVSKNAEYEELCQHSVAGITTITSIKFLTAGAETIQSGSQMTIYGVKRA